MNLNTHTIANVLLVLTVVFGGEAIAAKVVAKPAASTKTSEKSSPAKEVSVFATVGKETITWSEYEAEFKSTAKNQFFHGQPAPDVIAALQRTVADKLVNDALILGEAKRQKLEPDHDSVSQQVSRYDQRFANDAQWKQARDRVLPTLTKQFENQSLISKLEKNTRNVAEPSEVEVQAYYADHADKFATPPQPRVSLILLGVDPSSTTAEWQQTIADGKTLIKRVKDGENFADLAKQYSRDDATVDQGGDMGFLHDGMLPGLPQEVISNLKVGEISDPIRLLEGVAIFQLVDRKPAQLASFENSKKRATELWLADKGQATWSAFIANLKKQAKIKVDESRFLPLANAANSASTSPVLPMK